MIKILFFQGIKIGWIDYEENCYYAERIFSEHFFYKWNGYGLSISVLEILEKEGIEKIKLIIKDKHQILETTVSHFIVHGIDWTDSTFGKTEKQLILPLEFFNKMESTEKQIALGVFQ